MHQYLTKSLQLYQVKNTVIATGRRNGFWNLLMLSINGTVIKPAGTAAIKSTPNNLLGTVRNKLEYREEIPFW